MTRCATASTSRRRKLENYVRRERPKVPSQISQCGGAGTGCGWCIPFLKQIFHAAGRCDRIGTTDAGGIRTPAGRLRPGWRRHAAAGSDAAADGQDVIQARAEQDVSDSVKCGL